MNRLQIVLSPGDALEMLDFPMGMVLTKASISDEGNLLLEVDTPMDLGVPVVRAVYQPNPDGVSLSLSGFEPV